MIEKKNVERNEVNDGLRQKSAVQNRKAAFGRTGERDLTSREALSR